MNEASSKSIDDGIFFLYFRTSSLQRLRAQGKTVGVLIGDPVYRPPGSEFWWMPASGKTVFVAKRVREEMGFHRINLDSADVTRIGSVVSSFIGGRPLGVTVN